MFDNSELFQTIAELTDPSDTEIELSADFLFPVSEEEEQQTRWRTFVDLFFPELGVQKFFNVRGKNIIVSPGRGGVEAIEDMYRYMLVGDDKRENVLAFVKKQAKKQINAQGEALAPAKITKGKSRNNNNTRGVGAYNNEVPYRNNEFPYPNNEYNFYNNNGAENNFPTIGHTEEEEKWLSKLSKKNYTRFANEGGRRKRKAKRATRKLKRKH